MSKPLARFVVTIPDTKENNAIFDEAGDSIEVATRISTAIADELGFDQVTVRESEQ